MQDEVTVRDVMSRDFVGASEGDPVGEVAEVVVDECADCVVVLRGREPVGIVTLHDLIEHLVEGGDADDPVETAMEPPPDPIAVDSGVGAAIDRLSASGVDELPVEDGDDLVGVLTESDLVAAAASLLSTPEAGPDSPSADLAGAVEQGGGPDRDVGTDRVAGGGADEYSTQGVCESCGALTGELRDFNGQLLCRNCRAV